MLQFLRIQSRKAPFRSSRIFCLQPSWISVSTPEAGLEGSWALLQASSLGATLCFLWLLRQSLLPGEKILKWKHCWHFPSSPPSASSSTPRSTDQGFPVYPAFSEKILSSSWEIWRGVREASPARTCKCAMNPVSYALPETHWPFIGKPFIPSLHLLCCVLPFSFPWCSSTRSGTALPSLEQTSHKPKWGAEQPEFLVPVTGAEWSRPFWER